MLALALALGTATASAADGRVPRDGYVLQADVQGAEDLRWLDRALDEVEAARGWQAGSLGVIAIVESAWGILNLKEICAATARLRLDCRREARGRLTI